MATKADFTEEEWETLQKGVTGAGFWMTIADRGFFDTFKESAAMAKHLGAARQNASSRDRVMAGGSRTGGKGHEPSVASVPIRNGFSARGRRRKPGDGSCREGACR